MANHPSCRQWNKYGKLSFIRQMINFLPEVRTLVLKLDKINCCFKNVFYATNYRSQYDNITIIHQNSKNSNWRARLECKCNGHNLPVSSHHLPVSSLGTWETCFTRWATRAHWLASILINLKKFCIQSMLVLSVALTQPAVLLRCTKCSFVLLLLYQTRLRECIPPPSFTKPFKT